MCDETSQKYNFFPSNIQNMLKLSQSYQHIQDHHQIQLAHLRHQLDHLCLRFNLHQYDQDPDKKEKSVTIFRARFASSIANHAKQGWNVLYLGTPLTVHPTVEFNHAQKKQQHFAGKLLHHNPETKEKNVARAQIQLVTQIVGHALLGQNVLNKDQEITRFNSAVIKAQVFAS